MNLGHSPAATSSSSNESPAPNTYNIGSVSSNYTGSDPDSDSDNCNPQKMGASSAEIPSSGKEFCTIFCFAYSLGLLALSQ